MYNFLSKIYNRLHRVLCIKKGISHVLVENFGNSTIIFITHRTTSLYMSKSIFYLQNSTGVSALPTLVVAGAATVDHKAA